MDLLEFAVRYLGVVTVAVLVGGMVYKFIRYVALARVHTPKPEFRWVEHIERHAGIFNIGFWHWILWHWVPWRLPPRDGIIPLHAAAETSPIGAAFTKRWADSRR